MSEADLELLGGLTITNGLTVTGGTVDFSGASSGGGIELTDISATNAPLGTSSLSYNSTTGVFTYTPPDLSSYATTASLSNYALTSSLAAVATSGAYADITGTPSLATVATSGAYADITGTPSLATVATSGAYADITGTPTLATVATSGAYSDLTGTPSVPTTTDNLTEGSSNLYFTNARASSAITGSDLDMGGNKVLFANMYSAESNLPSATTYHGMFAHVHGTGKGYFAHNGNWVKLLDETSSTTTNLTEGTNLYYTNARVDSRLSSGNVATITTSGDITVGGDLTVSGTTTTVNTETINLADNTITLNSNYTGSSPTEDGGIEIERGTLTNKTLVWDETNDKWTVGSETFVAGTFEGNLTGNVTGTVSSLSNHDTDDVSEGASNLYYTDARARAAVSATNAAAGTAALSYNSSTGQFTFTPPDLSSYLTSASLSGYATTASLATVATSGAYSDLTGTPSLATVATSGAYSDLTGAPSLATVATSGAYSDLTGAPSLATVATSGAYSDLTGTPSLSGYLTDITGESLSDLSDVASTTPTDGQVLTYDTTNGWQPETPSSGGGSLAYVVSDNTTAPSGTLGTGTFTAGGAAKNGRNYNTNLGIAAGSSTQTGSTHDRNIAVGYAASYYGNDNVVMGYLARCNSSGGKAVCIGGSNGTFARASQDAVAVGYQAQASASDAIGIGSMVLADGARSVAIGKDADATHQGSMAFGYQAQATANYAVALGYQASTSTANQLILGKADTTSGFTSIRVGNTSYTPTDSMDLATKAYVDANAGGGSSGGLGSYGAVNSTGTAASATGVDAIAIGETSSSTAGGSIAIGVGATSGNDGGTAVGQDSTVNGNRGTAIGQDATAGVLATAFGYSTSATGTASMALGYNASTSTANQLMLGATGSTYGFTSIRVANTGYTPSDSMDLTTKSYVDTAVAAGGGGSTPTEIAFGSGGSAATSTGTESMALGSGATTGSSPYGIAIGDGASAQHTTGYNIAIGKGTTNATRYSVCIGSSASTGVNGNNSVVIGHGAYSHGASQVILGAFAYAGNYVNGGTAIGNYCYANGNSTVSVGTGYSNIYTTRAWSGGQAFGAMAYSESGGLAAGYSAYQTGYNATAVGPNTVATQSNSTALGNGASVGNSNQVVLGNSSISDLRCQDTSITAVSDRRDKTNIEALTVGLDFVNAVEPVSFYKNNRNDYYVGQYTFEELLENPELEQTYTFDQTSYDAGTQKYDKREFGFIAQEVAAQLPDTYADARVSYNETDAKHGYDVQRFTMGDMTPILWKALRELSDKHDQLQSDYDALLARVVALENA